MANQQEFQFPDTFVHLGEDGSAVPLEVTDTFSSDLIAGKFDHLGPGRLVSFFEFESDWDSWEVHPQGDEFAWVFSSSMDFVLDRPEGHRTVELRAPAALLVVPRGTWHTAVRPFAELRPLRHRGEGYTARPRIGRPLPA